MFGGNFDNSVNNKRFDASLSSPWMYEMSQRSLDKLTGSVTLYFVTIHVDSGISYKVIKTKQCVHSDMVTDAEEHSLPTCQAILRGKSFPFSEKYAGLDFTDYLTSAYFGVNRDVTKILK